MIKKRLLMLVLLILATVSAVESRYSLSVPFQVDAGGRPVSSAKVGINISEGTTCVTPFYYNITTVAFGRGQINVSSPRLIASRQYTICINATVGSNVVHGRTKFQSPVGDVNVSSLRGWVNGSRSRFDSYFLNNGSTFDTIYGLRGNIINNTDQSKIYLNNTNGVFLSSYLVLASRRIASILNGKILLNHTITTNSSLIVDTYRTARLSSSGIFLNHTTSANESIKITVNNKGFITNNSLGQLEVKNGNFTWKAFNSTRTRNCGLYISNGGVVSLVCGGVVLS